MAEAFLQVLLGNITSFIQGKLVLLSGFENDFKKLSSTFSTIQLVLEDASEKQLKDKAIENWLQKLNFAAYEVDDVLDECKNEAARLNQSLLGCIHPKIIISRYKLGKRMKRMMEKLDAIADERRKFHLREKIVEKQAAKRETGFVLAEPKVYGRDKEKDEMVKILINSVSNAQELLVLPILGMGGLGKTTLAQMIFNDQSVTAHFNLKIWVCVSDDFDEKRLIKAIVESIERRPLGDMHLAPLQKKLQELLNGKRYFLVLDDVWNEDQEKWAKIKAVLKVGGQGSSILATTRLERVGTIMGTWQPYQLSILSPEDCWLLFKQRAFGHQTETNPDLVGIGKEIVKKCGGVPLAAKTLGGLLRFKREESEWEHVKDSEIWNLPQDENSVLHSLRLSYHHLPLDLRQCFAHCAVFPKDTKIEKEYLITLWMAHGFLLSKGNLELEDVGNEVWKELYLRSFFQEVEEYKFGNTYFKMHDLIHDLATSLFSTNTRSSKIRQIRVAQKNTMSIGFAEVVPFYSPLILKRFVSLRVLDMKFSKVDQLTSSIGDLIHLRLLNLHGSSIRSLPKRLCKLQNLQTLDISCCFSLSYIPKQISKLRSLRNLVFKGCQITSMPPRIGSLTCLETLDYFIVGERKGYQLGELRNLNLHGSLSITYLERVKSDTDAKETYLSTKKKLYNLCMSWDIRPYGYESENNLDEKVLEALRPHSNLKSLKLIGFRGFHFPNWMNSSVLKNVVSIEIECENCWRLPPFGELPCLESLKLYNGSAEVEYIEEDDGHSTSKFPYLKRLAIERFPNLKGLLRSEGEEKFYMLEEMEIWHCPMFVFPAFSSVKKLDVWGEIDAASISSISKLTTLTSLSIDHNFQATTLPEEMFKRLVNLESLSIIYFKKLRELPSSLASLNALKCLKIHYCYALESLPEQGMEGLTSLTDLYVQNCEMLKCLPEGLQHLTALSSLQIYGCPALTKRCAKGIGEDWHKIAHIPNVDIC